MHDRFLRCCSVPNERRFPARGKFAMNILICHERFIFRFGADRVLILLGRGLKEQGHRVAIMANRYDRETVESFASDIVECPVHGDSLNSNEFTRDWLESNWDRLFSQSNRPDVVIVGGWPFFSAISFFGKVCRHVLFIDFGVVPNYGYRKEMVAILDKLRALRRHHLRDASLIVAISRFIAESQSRPDSGDVAPIRSILLGADHLSTSRWFPTQFKAGSSDGRVLDTVRSLKRQGKKVLLCLGRWEPGCYKNSQAALEVIESLRAVHSDCVLLVLEHASHVELPDHLKNAVFPVGFPDDQELLEIMSQVDLGLSPSLWEGFNLPLAEMQWAGRPALTLDVAAHPEVVAHPWYLCRDTAEMTAKATELLDGKGPEFSVISESLKNFRRYFQWDRLISEYSQIMELIETMDGYGTVSRSSATSIVPGAASANGFLSDAWSRALYRGCLCENWQMHDSERLALAGLLARHRPYCSVEVGTYHGGSLSLISQYSKMIFSIDIDETIPSRLNLSNVNFLTGFSHVILPHLLDELDRADIPVEFILIDGDHSAPGVKRDIACLFTYVPKKPMFVALHDSFNPECRQGMLEAGWERSPYCHWLDLDFVPGRLGGQQLWGGLALAHFLPVIRNGDLQINRSAEEMFQALTAPQASTASAP